MVKKEREKERKKERKKEREIQNAKKRNKIFVHMVRLNLLKGSSQETGACEKMFFL